MSTQAKIFIDGAAGTTGLEIRERLAGRGELALITLSDAERKDAAARKRALNDADLVILCLPDEAARESRGPDRQSGTRVIDASTAHRVAPGWAYGICGVGAGSGTTRSLRQAGQQSRLLGDGFSGHRAAAGAGGACAGSFSGHGQRRIGLFRRRQKHDRGVRGQGVCRLYRDSVRASMA